MDDEEVETPSKPSFISQILVLGLTTMVAFGGGWGFGKFFLNAEPGMAAPGAGAVDAMEPSGPKKQDADHENLPADKGADQPADPVADVEQVEAGQAVALEPIVANLAAPEDVWVRLEMSVLFGETPNPEIVQAIHQDVLAYIKTVKLHQVDGPSGYLHLKSDLKDLVKTRSEGVARGVLISALLFE